MRSGHGQGFSQRTGSYDSSYTGAFRFILESIQSTFLHVLPGA